MLLPVLHCLFITGANTIDLKNRSCRAVTRSSLNGRSEVQILGRSNRTQSCQRLTTAATILQKKLCCPGAMMRRWAPQTRYTLRRNTANITKNLNEVLSHPLLAVNMPNSGWRWDFCSIKTRIRHRKRCPGTSRKHLTLLN